ncbi:MAG: indole-3-glycerol phosphate synthase TrpC [Dysgonamonadaceae bacterium]|jgi:indole-3-glycerol phosphate synthase|nr:indole-3-glycerol phosphate synthase TrpC [Dysgonamonadaceae bacterium]
MNILETICENKHKEVAQQKEAIPLTYLKGLLNRQKREVISFKKALSESETGIIAEFKRKSPSKGQIHPNADVESIVSGYERNGAAAISCLTDSMFFGGSFNDFKIARNTISAVPLLRKDFIVDEYQVYQSKAIGADIILLIAACLHPDQSYRFANIAHSLEMEVLLEIHNEEELEHIHPNIDVVGINNRDLKTFKTDIQHTINLSKKIPESFLKISESGLSDPQIMMQLRPEGFKGFLMGETFMKTENPAQTLNRFIKQIR